MLNHKLNQFEFESNQPANTNNNEQQKSHENQSQIVQRESKRVEWIGSVVLPVVLTTASLFIGWVQFHIQDNQIKKSIIKEYIDNISSLKFDRNLDLVQSETELKINQLQSEQLKAESSLKKITLQERLGVLAAIINRTFDACFQDTI